MWPLHLKPQDDELLSSWIIRLAHVHGYKVETFCTLLFGHGSAIWNRDIDVLAPAYVKKALIDVTGVTDVQFDKTTLRDLEGSLFENINIHGVTPWVLSLGVDSRARKRRGLACCPQCLSSDTHPYYRRKWRLAFSTVCLLHDCQLIDACPKCLSPIAPHRVDMVDKGVLPEVTMISKCWHCGIGLDSIEVNKVDTSTLSNFQSIMENALHDGWLEWAGNNSMHSLLYFKGVHELVTGIMRKETKERISRNYKSAIFRNNDDYSKELEYSSIKFRYNLFGLCSWILQEWPERFFELFCSAKLRYSDLKVYSEPMVYWYEVIIKQGSLSGNPILDDAEKQSIIDSVKLEQGYYSNKSAKRISGRDISKYAKSEFDVRVSEDVYEDLMVSIDQEIGGTQNKLERISLIRDKIMFAFARMFRLHEMQLSGLKLDNILELCDEITDVNFYTNATSKCSVCAWMHWYIGRIRPSIKNAMECDAVFMSVYTGLGLKKSAISLRFNRAVKYANLQRYIKTYHAWINR